MVQVTKPQPVAMGSFVIDCHIVSPDRDRRQLGRRRGLLPRRPGQAVPNPVPQPGPEAGAVQQPAGAGVRVGVTRRLLLTAPMEPQYMMLGHASGLARGAGGRPGRVGDLQEMDVSALQSKLREQKAVLALPGVRAEKAAALPGIVADDGQAELTGDWVVSTFAAGVGGSYRHDGNKGKGRKSARFELRVPANGQYEVRLAYAAFANRATNVPVTIDHAGGGRRSG